MTISWYSISFNRFSGYFKVDGENVIAFYETINGTTDFNTNILRFSAVGDLFSPTNIFRSSDGFINNGINILSNTLLNIGYDVNREHHYPYFKIYTRQQFDLNTLFSPNRTMINVLYVTNFYDSYLVVNNYNITAISDPTLPAPISNICFPAGTPITTNQGNIPIEKINSNIHTIRNKKIVGITKTITPDKYLVCFEKDSLGNNIPNQKTIMTKNHKIFYKGKMISAYECLKQFENVYKIKYNGEILYNVLMEEHDKMCVNNIISETLHPENGIAELYKYLQNLNPKEQLELIKAYNICAKEENTFSSKKINK